MLILKILGDETFHRFNSFIKDRNVFYFNSYLPPPETASLWSLVPRSRHSAVSGSSRQEQPIFSLRSINVLHLPFARAVAFSFLLASLCLRQLHSSRFPDCNRESSLHSVACSTSHKSSCLIPPCFISAATLVSACSDECVFRLCLLVLSEVNVWNFQRG